jgi:ferritin
MKADMITQKMADALNGQVRAELYSSNLYLAMAAYYESANLKGFAHWMKIQAQEEMAHAMKFYSYLIDRSGRAKIMAVDEPPFAWASPLAAMEAAYQHEVEVTGLINGLVELSRNEKDNATFNLLQWFVAEQVEEEKSVDEVVQRLKIVSDKSVGLIVVDGELAQRKSG